MRPTCPRRRCLSSFKRAGSLSLLLAPWNSELSYPKYFSMLPTGQNTKASFTEDLDTAAAQFRHRRRLRWWLPMPNSRAMPVQVRADTSRSSSRPSDKTYPPTMTDFTSVVRAVQAANPDIVCICSYPAIRVIARRRLARARLISHSFRHGRQPSSSGAARRQLQVASPKPSHARPPETPIGSMHALPRG